MGAAKSPPDRAEGLEGPVGKTGRLQAVGYGRDRSVDQRIRALALQTSGEQDFRSLGGDFHRCSLDVLGRLLLGQLDALVGQSRATHDLFFQLGLGFGFKALGLGLGGGDHFGGLTLGFSPLLTQGVQQLGRFIPQGLSLVEGGLDLGCAIVESLARRARHLEIGDEAEEQDQADADPAFRFLQEIGDEFHIGPLPYLAAERASSAASTSADSEA